MGFDLVLFAVLAAIAVVCALSMVIYNDPVRCALSLVGVLMSVAFLFLELHASFLAAAQVIVYAGAIMVLFVFVIMLLNLGANEQVKNALKSQSAFAGIAGLILALVIVGGILSLHPGSTLLPHAMTGPPEIGLVMFSQAYVFPFEAISILLLIAVIGAVVLAKRRLT